MKKNNIFKIIIACVIMTIIGIGINKYINIRKIASTTNFNSSENMTEEEKIQNLISYNNQTMDDTNMKYDIENNLITLSVVDKDFDDFSDIADSAKTFNRITEEQKSKMNNSFSESSSTFANSIKKIATENFNISDFDNINFRIIYLDSKNNTICIYYNEKVLYTIYDTEVPDESYIKNNRNKSISGPLSREEAVNKIIKESNLNIEYVDVFPYEEADKIKNGIKYYHIEAVSKDGKGAAATYYVNSQTGEIINYLDLE